MAMSQPLPQDRFQLSSKSAENEDTLEKVKEKIQVGNLLSPPKFSVNNILVNPSIGIGYGGVWHKDNQNTKQLDSKNFTRCIPHVKRIIPQDVTAETFELLARKSNIPVVVFFYRKNCKYSQSMYNIVGQMAGIFNNRVKFLKADVDQNLELFNKYFKSDKPIAPAYLFLKYGKTVGGTAGMLNMKKFLASINQLIGPPPAQAAPKK